MVGFVIGGVWFVVLVLLLFRSTRSEIPMSQIRSIWLKERFGGRFLDVRLPGSRTRRVSHIEKDCEWIADYISVNFSAEVK
jgi:hypothetical protein